MNETELAKYARQKGLYAEQIQAWKDVCSKAIERIEERWKILGLFVNEPKLQIKSAVMNEIKSYQL